MSADLTQFAHLLRRRIELLRRCSQEVQMNCGALAELRAEQAHEGAAQEEQLLRELAFVLRELEEAGKKLQMASGAAPNSSATAAEKIAALLHEEEEARQDLRRRNRVRAAFLRRARRSVNVLMNLIAQFSGTYPAPAAVRSGASERRA